MNKALAGFGIYLGSKYFENACNMKCKLKFNWCECLSWIIFTIVLNVYFKPSTWDDAVHDDKIRITRWFQEEYMLKEF